MSASKIKKKLNSSPFYNNLSNLLRIAYLKLKQNIYYDKADLNLRYKFSKFEAENDLDTKFEEIKAVIISNLEENLTYKGWINKISYFIIPKSIKNTSRDITQQFTFISNVRTADTYYVDRVNYIIDAPIELHIISVLWIMLCGKYIDKNLSESCYGYRLHNQVHEKEDNSNQLFTLYHEQYSRWRNNAIKKAKYFLENEKENVAILGLDLKEYFYSIEIDIALVKSDIDNGVDDLDISNKLCPIISDICYKYTEITRKYRNLTHSDNCSSETILPIGISFSGILANWYLNKLDDKILELINPVYYGRYVDDILIVFRKINISDPEEFINDYFVKKRILKRSSQKDLAPKYKVVGYPYLEIQASKFRLQYCDHKHSSATIEKFKKEIDKNSSAFRFLPTDDLKDRLNNVAYDLMYDGSINKFSSVKGISENRYEVSKYFAKQIAAHQLVETPVNEDALNDIRQFFQGKNIIDFSILWEKAFSYFVIKNTPKEFLRFYENISVTISKIDVDIINESKSESDSNLVDILKNKIRRQLRSHLKYSLSISVSLDSDLINKIFRKDSKDLEFFIKIANYFRSANMLRHNLVYFSLINYTTYEGSYLKRDLPTNLEIDQNRIHLSPRYIHLHEYLLFYLWDNLNHNTNDHLYFENTKSIMGYDGDISCHKDQNAFRWDICSNHEPKEFLKIAIANIEVFKNNIELSFNGKPNLSIEREYDLWKLLNQIECEKERVDLFVMPEVSIPYFWLPKLVEYAKHHMLGMVFGLEHINYHGVVYNLIVTLLPYYSKDGFQNCFIRPRIKNHYSHEEKHILTGNKYKIPEIENPIYDLFTWKGINFSVYNCFEITNITERALFKGNLDFIIISEYNRDIEYFSNIAESSARDLHCYVIQVNSSDFGDSRIVQPSKSYKKDIVRIKGGENSTILTAKINIKKLREFQNTEYKLHKENEEFKPMPAAFERFET